MRLEIIAHFPQFTYFSAGYFAYDAAEDIINYDTGRLDCDAGRLCLLHEIAHAQLGHLNYSTDLELLLMEQQAWRRTIALAGRLSIPVDHDYIKDCLASYDNWLMARGRCPDCGNFCLNDRQRRFHCFVCGCEWMVNARLDAAVRRHRLPATQNPANQVR